MKRQKHYTKLELRNRHIFSEMNERIILCYPFHAWGGEAEENT